MYLISSRILVSYHEIGTSRNWSCKHQEILAEKINVYLQLSYRISHSPEFFNSRHTEQGAKILKARYQLKRTNNKIVFKI